MKLTRIVAVLLVFAPLLTALAPENDAATPCRFTLTYSVNVKDFPAESESAEIWIPIPQSTLFQRIERLVVTTPVPYRITREEEYGNALLYVKLTQPLPKDLAVTITATATRWEAEESVNLTDQGVLIRFTAPDKLGIVDDKIKEIARKIVAGKGETTAKARAVYDYVLDKMEYNKETPGWGKGDTQRACDVGKGNCSDYHALFISLCRAAEIPARFNYGFILPAKANEAAQAGMPAGESGKAIPHCWAEFYTTDGRWIPVDCSEADKNPALKDYYFGKLSPNRLGMTIGRDIVLFPKQKGEPLNFLISPYVEVDGKVHGAVTTDYTYKMERAK